MRSSLRSGGRREQSDPADDDTEEVPVVTVPPTSRSPRRVARLVGPVALIGVVLGAWAAGGERTGRVVVEAAQAAVPLPEDPGCGDPPVFAADPTGPDPLDVNGTPGPGPGGRPAAPGQHVAHWLGGPDVVVELRWPTDVDPAPGGRAPTSMGEDGLEWRVAGTDRGGVASLEVVGAGRCATLTLEASAPIADAAMDQLLSFVERTRLRAGMAAYLEAVDAARTTAALPGDIEPGACAAPIGTTATATDEAVLVLVTRFLDDRRAGLGAHECLNRVALQAFDGSSLCLLACAHGAVDLAPEPLLIEGYGIGSTLVSTVVGHPGGQRVRETYEVAPVEGVDGTRLLIVGALPGPESWVDDREARALLRTYLDLLATGDVDGAAGLLVNEGVGHDVYERLGGAVLEEGRLPALLAEYCASAHCDSHSEILPGSEATEHTRTYEVVFTTAEGVVAAPFTVSTFEGRMTVTSLPPRR